MIDFDPLWLTAKLAFITTLILLLLAIPLCYWLTYGRLRFKAVIEAIISLPLVLPPSVLGFYLLIAFSPENAFGKFLSNYFDNDTFWCNILGTNYFAKEMDDLSNYCFVIISFCFNSFWNACLFFR